MTQLLEKRYEDAVDTFKKAIGSIFRFFFTIKFIEFSKNLKFSDNLIFRKILNNFLFCRLIFFNKFYSNYLKNFDRLFII